MKPYDLLRLVITAFAAHLTANPGDAAAVQTAEQKANDLQVKLDEANRKLAADEAVIGDLGTPLSAEENDHLAALLKGALNTAPVDLPPAPPAPAVEPAPPGDSVPAGSGAEGGLDGAS